MPGFHTCVGVGGERQDAAWYAEKGITYLTGTRVTSADLASKTLTTAAGDTVTYEKLVVATGARPTTLSDIGVPGGDLGGVLYLRNEADAAELVEAMAGIKATDGKVRPEPFWMSHLSLVLPAVHVLPASAPSRPLTERSGLSPTAARLLDVPPAACTACCVYCLLPAPKSEVFA